MTETLRTRSLSATVALLAVVVLLSLAVLETEAKKNRKIDLPQGPQWKSGSGPKKNVKFESVNEGSEVKLDCRAKGKGYTKVTWLKDGQPISDNGGDKYEVQKFKLTVPSAKPGDKGNYTCRVSSADGEIEWTFYVDVIVRMWPLEVEGPQNVTVTEGETARFRCRVLNDPDATIKWIKNFPASAPHMDGAASSNFGSPTDYLDNNANPEVLQLAEVTEAEAGEYRCLAGNVWGLKYSSAWLTVNKATTTTMKTTTTTTKTTPTTRTTTTMSTRTTTTTKATTTKTTPTSTTTTTTTPEPYPYYTTTEMYSLSFTPSGGKTLAPRYPGPTFMPDLYVTTKTPKNKDRKKGRKNGGGRRRNKNRKNKDKSPTTPFLRVNPSSPALDGFSSSSTTSHSPHEEHFTTIWNFNEDIGGYDDNTAHIAEEEAEEGNVDRSKGKGEISLWTIYTIVGTIAGVILLIGLLAITIALCCRRDGSGVYKSTPV